MKPIVDISIPGCNGSTQQQPPYDEALHQCLQESNLGEVIGGGSPVVDGSEFRDLEIEVTHLEDALLLLRNELSYLKVPVGTKLLYIEEGQEIEEKLGPEGWTLRSLSACEATA